MIVQSCICQVSIKNNLSNFLTLSKIFANFGFTIVNVSLFRLLYFACGGCYKYHVIIVSIVTTHFNHVTLMHPSKNVKGVLAVQVLSLQGLLHSRSSSFCRKCPCSLEFGHTCSKRNLPKNSVLIFHETACIKRQSFSKAFHQSKLALISKV